MDPHPLANLFKRSNYDEPIASEFCALDYLYEVLLEICESEKCDELLYEAVHDRSLNKKHDCNDFITNSIYVNCANNMQNPNLGDASFAMSSTCCNDHDWGDYSYDLENLFKPDDEYEIDNSVCNIIESGSGEIMTLVNVNPTIWKSVNFACMWIMLKIFYVIAILLNFLMILHVIITRKENMVVEIFMLVNYLSLC